MIPKASKAGNLRKYVHEIELNGEKIPLCFTMEGGEYLAIKYGSIIDAFNILGESAGDKLKLTPDQINIIADFLLACTYGRFEDTKVIKRLMTFKTMGGIMTAIHRCINDNNPQVEEDDLNPPVKP